MFLDTYHFMMVTLSMTVNVCQFIQLESDYVLCTEVVIFNIICNQGTRVFTRSNYEPRRITHTVLCTV